MNRRREAWGAFWDLCSSNHQQQLGKNPCHICFEPSEEKCAHDILYDTFLTEEWRISIPASFLIASKILIYWCLYKALLSMSPGSSAHFSIPYEVERSFISLGQAFFLFQSRVWKIKVIGLTPSKPLRFRNSPPEERSGMLNQYVF